MKRLFPYIKPYWPLILLAMGLLYVMASTNLALPDYLSQIINIGIQQNGVDTTIPETIRASSLEKIALFQSEQERAVTLAAYDRIEPGTPESAALVPYYPGASLQPVYKLKSLDSAAKASSTWVSSTRVKIDVFSLPVPALISAPIASKR